MQAGFQSGSNVLVSYSASRRKMEVIEAFASMEEAEEICPFILTLGDRFQVMRQFKPDYLPRSRQGSCPVSCSWDPLPQGASVSDAISQAPKWPGVFGGSWHCLVTFHLGVIVLASQPAPGGVGNDTKNPIYLTGRNWWLSTWFPSGIFPVREGV